MDKSNTESSNGVDKTNPDWSFCADGNNRESRTFVDISDPVSRIGMEDNDSSIWVDGCDTGSNTSGDNIDFDSNSWVDNNRNFDWTICVECLFDSNIGVDESNPDACICMENDNFDEWGSIAKIVFDDSEADVILCWEDKKSDASINFDGRDSDAKSDIANFESSFDLNIVFDVDDSDTSVKEKKLDTGNDGRISVDWSNSESNISDADNESDTGCLTLKGVLTYWLKQSPENVL